jgi:hypothetical protein
MSKRLAVRLAVVATVVLCARLAAAQDHKPDDEGFIRNWLMLAPFPLADDSGAAEQLDKQQMKDEGKIRPKAGDTAQIGKNERKWQAVAAKDYYIDFNETLGGRHENVLGYLVCYIDCPQEMKNVQLLMGSNDQAKVYVNGKEVVKFTDTRTIEKDSDKAEGVTLNRGSNLIVFKVINEVNNWQACLRLKKSDGSVIKDFTVKLAE